MNLLAQTRHRFNFSIETVIVMLDCFAILRIALQSIYIVISRALFDLTICLTLHSTQTKLAVSSSMGQYQDLASEMARERNRMGLTSLCLGYKATDIFQAVKDKAWLLSLDVVISSQVVGRFGRMPIASFAHSRVLI